MNPALKGLPRKYSVEEYFEFLSENEGRYEYHAGEIRMMDGKTVVHAGNIHMMAGGTDNHSLIKVDVLGELRAATKKGSCEPYDSDMAVYIPSWDAYVLPDMSFVCEEAQFGDEARRRLLNPALLVEVISETSGEYDRGEKFQKYRSLESFREYMLIDSRRYSVECWYREDDKVWRIDSALELSASVYLHTLDVHLPLTEIYRRVTFK